MKKFGLLLCLLLGLTACGQEQKEPVFATLDEAIEAHLDANIGSRLEEIGQTENAHIVAFTESRHSGMEENPPLVYQGVPVYFVIYEETEDGFILREETPKLLLSEGEGPSGVLGELDWITKQKDEEVQYHLKGVCFGTTPPTEEELEELVGFGEVHERYGYYFSVALETEWSKK